MNTMFFIGSTAPSGWGEKTMRCAKEKNANCSTAICEWTNEALRWFDLSIAMLFSPLLMLFLCALFYKTKRGRTLSHEESGPFIKQPIRKKLEVI